MISEVQIDQSEGSQQQPGSPSQRSPPCTGLTDRQPEGILRRNSDCGATPTGSNKDLRRSSDFAQEKTRSQFATKLRRNSDFGNRVPRRSPEPESAGLKLSRILDVSPVGEFFFITFHLDRLIIWMFIDQTYIIPLCTSFCNCFLLKALYNFECTDYFRTCVK